MPRYIRSRILGVGIPFTDNFYIRNRNSPLRRYGSRVRNYYTFGRAAAFTGSLGAILGRKIINDAYYSTRNYLINKFYKSNYNSHNNTNQKSKSSTNRRNKYNCKGRYIPGLNCHFGGRKSAK